MTAGSSLGQTPLTLPEGNRQAMAKFREAWDRKHGGKFFKLLSPVGLRIARRRMAARHNRAQPITARLFTGQTMHVMLPEVVSGSIYSYGYFDECVTAFMLHAVRPGDTVLDIGAHFGFFSLLAADLVGETGQVVSFEPTPSTFAQLSRNLEGYATSTRLNVALGRAEGTATMNDFGLELCAWNFMGDDHRVTVPHDVQPQSFDVPVVTVDSVVDRQGLAPAVLKIDTENYEEEVFHGAKKTLADHGPAVILEAKSEYSERVGAALIAMGYVPYRLGDGFAVIPAHGNWEELNRQESNLLFMKHS